MKRKVVILGSTGSIGTSALKVARDLPQRMEVVGLAANRSVDALLGQIAEVKPLAVTVTDEKAFHDVRSGLNGHRPRMYCGLEGLEQIAVTPEADLVLVAIVGTAGLAPALAAIRAGKDIAVASKEILVIAGEMVMAEAKKHGVQVFPVDSEHSAIWQCLDGKPVDSIKRLILTASGGPFRGKKRAELEEVTLEQALKHPTWTMGKKITIDSATLFNKGLEMIEARWLFNLPIQQVDVIVHPQSIIHSMVEYNDGSIIAQMSVNDMCYPIQYAVTYPDRVPNTMKPLDLASLKALTFEEPDAETFVSLQYAREAAAKGGTLPSVFNAANEVCVEKFLNRKIKFTRIWDVVGECMSRHRVIEHPDLETVKDADTWARQTAESLT
ncbi:MAG: 1-deoxy-D-xylulose-5-phosphate reductoisomerase, partial [Verrucomicrobiae bacterium]|nr:1-deoxy-D-xylulose-5-phosphate reductoisomerase [Verrucomicrobiae bacterium]